MKPLNILIVDDCKDTSKMMGRLLQMDGHKIDTATSIQEANQKINNGEFDLLLSDLSLPDGNGLDMIRDLRKKENWIMAIAVTGYCMKSDIDACMDAGFDAYIGKPFEISELKQTIEKVTLLPS